MHWANTNVSFKCVYQLIFLNEPSGKLPEVIQRYGSINLLRSHWETKRILRGLVTISVTIW